MSFEEKSVWTYLVCMAGAYVVYLAIVVPRLVHTTAADVSFIPPLTLTTVAAAIVALLARSAMEVARPSDTGDSDVRDRDIARSAERPQRWCLVAGSIAAFGLATGHAGYFWIANVAYLGLLLSIVVGSVVRLVAYRRGL